MNYLLGFFFAITFFSKAQYQFGFPVEGAEWVQATDGPWVSIPKHDFYKYIVNGDTVINNKVYKKIYSQSLFRVEKWGQKIVIIRILF